MNRCPGCHAPWTARRCPYCGLRRRRAIPYRPESKWATHAEFAAAAAAGETLQAIGDRYGITRERVRQILAKHFTHVDRKGAHRRVLRAARVQRERARETRIKVVAAWNLAEARGFTVTREIREPGNTILTTLIINGHRCAARQSLVPRLTNPGGKPYFRFNISTAAALAHHVLIGVLGDTGHVLIVPMRAVLAIPPMRPRGLAKSDFRMLYVPETLTRSDYNSPTGLPRTNAHDWLQYLDRWDLLRRPVMPLLTAEEAAAIQPVHPHRPRGLWEQTPWFIHALWRQKQPLTAIARTAGLSHAQVFQIKRRWLSKAAQLCTCPKGDTL